MHKFLIKPQILIMSFKFKSFNRDFVMSFAGVILVLIFYWRWKYSFRNMDLVFEKKTCGQAFDFYEKIVQKYPNLMSLLSIDIAIH